MSPAQSKRSCPIWTQRCFFITDVPDCQEQWGKFMPFSQDLTFPELVPVSHFCGSSGPNCCSFHSHLSVTHSPGAGLEDRLCECTGGFVLFIPRSCPGSVLVCGWKYPLNPIKYDLGEELKSGASWNTASHTRPGYLLFRGLEYFTVGQPRGSNRAEV